MLKQTFVSNWHIDNPFFTTTLKLIERAKKMPFVTNRQLAAFFRNLWREVYYRGATPLYI